MIAPLPLPLLVVKPPMVSELIFVGTDKVDETKINNNQSWMSLMLKTKVECYFNNKTPYIIDQDCFFWRND